MAYADNMEKIQNSSIRVVIYYKDVNSVNLCKFYHSLFYNRYILFYNKLLLCNVG